jgi:hypothetical protein
LVLKEISSYRKGADWIRGEHSVVEKEYESKVLADESVTKEKEIQAWRPVW